ncbi:MAG: hypothetical protein ABJE95_15120 [Byssovorax sp.]
MTVFSDPQRLRLRAGLAAASLLALLAAPGCDDDPETQAPDDAPATATQSGDLASFTFEAIAYVEPSANNIAVLDRVRHELGSALTALQLRQITISQRRQVDVDLKRLSRESITVVDPVTHSARPAVRVRYRFVGLALVPKDLALHRDVLLGLLHRDDAVHFAEVIDACTAPPARTGSAVRQPWTIFNPALDACAAAIDAEQTKIDEARAGLEHPEREIVPIERDRIYLPVMMHVRLRTATGALADGSAHPAASSAAAAASGGPAGSGAPAAGSAAVAPIDMAAVEAERREARLLAKLKQAEKADDDDDEDREVAEILARRGGAGTPGGSGKSSAPFLGYGRETQPLNYALLWFASVAVIALLGTEIRRRLLRRGTRRPRR